VWDGGRSFVNQFLSTEQKREKQEQEKSVEFIGGPAQAHLLDPACLSAICVSPSGPNISPG